MQICASHFLLLKTRLLLSRVGGAALLVFFETSLFLSSVVLSVSRSIQSDLSIYWGAWLCHFANDTTMILNFHLSSVLGIYVDRIQENLLLRQIETLKFYSFLGKLWGEWKRKHKVWRTNDLRTSLETISIMRWIRRLQIGIWNFRNSPCTSFKEYHTLFKRFGEQCVSSYMSNIVIKRHSPCLVLWNSALKPIAETLIGSRSTSDDDLDEIKLYNFYTKKSFYGWHYNIYW